MTALLSRLLGADPGDGVRCPVEIGGVVAAGVGIVLLAVAGGAWIANCIWGDLI